MTAKILAGVGLFFAIVALILKSVAVSVPHFVDVHLVRNPDEANDGNRLGGVGVFTSEFNSELEGDILDDIDEASIPPLNLELPTLEFPLLFPSQENFIFDVLPLSDELLDDLADTFGDIIKLGIETEQDAVQNLEFNGNCDEFGTEANDAVLDFFQAFQANTLPVAIGGVGTVIVQTIEETIINTAILPTLAGGQALGSVTIGVADTVIGNADALIAAGGAGLEAACASFNVAANLTLDAGSRACLAGIFTVFEGSLAGDNTVFPDNLARVVLDMISDPATCVDGDTVAGCIQNNFDKFELVDTALNVAAEFTDNTAPQLCDAVCPNGNTKADFLRDVVLESFKNSGNAQLEAAAEGYEAFFNLVDATLIAANSDFTTAFDILKTLAVTGTAFDDEEDGNQAYANPCLVLNIATDNTPPCATLADYLTILPPVLEASGNPLAGTVGGIADLYLAFFGEAVGAPLSVAPGGFTGQLLGGAYSTVFQAVNGSFAQPVANECADDVEDNDKIAQAQVLVVTSTVFEGLAILLVIVGLILPVDKLAFLAPAGAVASVLGGIGILGALFVVRSAPVYEGVGDEGNGELDIFFIQGYVPLLALVDAVLFFLCAVLLVVSTVLACKEKNAEEAGEEAAAEEKEDAMAAKMEDNL